MHCNEQWERWVESKKERKVFYSIYPSHPSCQRKFFSQCVFWTLNKSLDGTTVNKNLLANGISMCFMSVLTAFCCNGQGMPSTEYPLWTPLENTIKILGKYQKALGKYFWQSNCISLQLRRDALTKMKYISFVENIGKTWKIRGKTLKILGTIWKNTFKDLGTHLYNTFHWPQC